VIRAIIGDKNIKAIEYLRTIINELDCNIKVVGEVTKKDQVLDTIIRTNANLMFMDIDPECGCLPLSKAIVEICPNMIIIYTTVYPQFCLEALESNAIVLGYLLKPFSKEMVVSCLEKISRYANNKVIIKDKYDIYHYLNIKDIYFVEYESHIKNCIVHCRAKIIHTTGTLLNIEAILRDHTFFVRSHKSYLINKLNIDRIIPYNNTSDIIKFKHNYNKDALVTKDKLSNIL